MANSQKPQEDWHPADIKAAIQKKGTTIAELARNHGYDNATAFYRALTMRYPKVQKIIAKFLDTTPEEIWPSLYIKPKVDFKTSSHKAHSSAA